MSLTRTALSIGVVVALMGAGGAQAQESEAPATQSDEPAAPAAKSPWSFRATSYLWFAGINGDVGVGGLGPVDVDVSFGDIFGNLDWTPPPIMLVGEVRYDRFGFITDFIYLGLDGEGATAVPVPITAEAELDTIVWTFAGAYRAIENDTFSLDLRAGGRLWNLQSEVTLAAPGATLQASGSKTWVDPIIGIAGQVNLGDGFALRAVGDVGGFGAAADIDWQVVGALQYQLNDSIALEAGYRYLAVDYQDGGFIFDAALSGPIMGASFRF